MILLGLTGGVGMGKSTAAKLLHENLDLPIVDTDVLARELVEPGQPALQEIYTLWGQGVIGPDGRLLRTALAESVFRDSDARKELESILHPRIRQAWLTQAQTWRSEGRPVGVVVIPLLFETAAEKDLDRILCVACSARTQRARLRPRGWTDEQCAQRIAAQWPVDKKMAAADFVVWSEGTLDVHLEQLRRIFAHY
jgi:dephospho-CoA kinase